MIKKPSRTFFSMIILLLVLVMTTSCGPARNTESPPNEILPVAAIPGNPVLAQQATLTPGGPIGTLVNTVGYDFVANVCRATWFSGAGQLPCPGTDGDAKGFVLRIDNPQLETGAADTRAGILTFPQNVQDGYIQGFYPPFNVQNGDRFRSTISCENGATNCYVAARLDYQIGTDPIRTFWGPFLERYEGSFYNVDVDLSSLAGQDVKFILTVLAAGAATGDRALWVGPIIHRAGTVTTLVPSETPGSDWLLFSNSKYRFEFKYPKEGQILEGRTDNYARINLSIVPGTNLTEKYLENTVVENANACRSPLATQSIPQASEMVIINNVSYLKETGAEGVAGGIFRWTAYSTSRGNICVSLSFVLHSANPDVFATPPPLYDEAAEAAVFGPIVSTLAWLADTLTSSPTLTPTPTPTSTYTPTPTPTDTPRPASTDTPTPTPSVMPTNTSTSTPVPVNDQAVQLAGEVSPQFNTMFGIQINPSLAKGLDTARIGGPTGQLAAMIAPVTNENQRYIDRKNQVREVEGIFSINDSRLALETMIIINKGTIQYPLLPLGAYMLACHPDRLNDCIAVSLQGQEFEIKPESVFITIIDLVSPPTVDYEEGSIRKCFRVLRRKICIRVFR